MTIYPERKTGSKSWRKLLGGLSVMMISFAMVSPPMQGFAAMPGMSGHYTPLLPADQIVVYKSKRLMYLLRQGRIEKKYHISLGRNPIGHKLEWGDMRTPEGKYTIDLKNANSQFYRSMRISYPDPTDADVAAALSTNPGDWIMIHGMPNGRGLSRMKKPYGDWTNGCIAVSNAEMDEIWQMVGVGTKISIWP